MNMYLLYISFNGPRMLWSGLFAKEIGICSDGIHL